MVLEIRGSSLCHLLPQAQVPPSVASGCQSLCGSGWDRAGLTRWTICWRDFWTQQAARLA